LRDAYCKVALRYHLHSKVIVKNSVTRSFDDVDYYYVQGPIRSIVKRRSFIYAFRLTISEEIWFDMVRWKKAPV
jgi:hypothetical protein